MSEAKKPRLVVVMEGGIIHGLVADAPIEVAVVDYDAEGAEPDFVSQVAQLDTDGSVSGYEDAVVSLPHVEVETPGNWLPRVFADAEADAARWAPSN